LHIVESLDRGAVENWLLRMLSHARRRGVPLDWTFYCQLERPGALDGEARSLGAGVIQSPVALSRKTAFMRALRREIGRGRYDVLHCHHDLLSAMYLMASLGLPIGRRIVHVHNASQDLPTANRVKQALYRAPFRYICLRISDTVAANSNHTLDTFLAGRARLSNRHVICPCAVDAEPFRNARADRIGFRRSLGLPDDALILLFAGRIVPEKNPLFALEVLAEIHRRDHRVYGVFAGTGSLEPDLHQRAKELDIADALRPIGWRSDLPEIMCSSDCFILPSPESPMEGFGLAVLEAQLAGLPLLLSGGVPDDPLLPGAVLRRLPLAAGANTWADAALALLGDGAPSRSAAGDHLMRSPFHPDNALSAIMALHNSIELPHRQVSGPDTRDLTAMARRRV
jgi:glycosyltransferase involved in cell wall biosynthesis